ncbi:MAG: alpha/beta hydrolase [Treponema socranskii subsp. buccale]
MHKKIESLYRFHITASRFFANGKKIIKTNMRRARTVWTVLFIVFSALPLSASRRAVFLWQGVRSMKNCDSVMFMSRPENANGAALIICPGGSYHHLGMYNEGHCTAKRFNALGVTTFVLRYRVAQGGAHHPAQLEDIQRAIQLVRENARDYGIDPGRVGAIGFSAGGHLVTMAGAFAESGNELAKLGIDVKVSLRPDCVMAIYPVVSMRDDIANKWSRKSLLGKNMSEERKERFSMEKQIPPTMPPTYILACRDDPVVKFENSRLLYASLKAKHIPCRFAQYETGGHGFGMLEGAFMKKTHWNEDIEAWLKENGMLPH